MSDLGSEARPSYSYSKLGGRLLTCYLKRSGNYNIHVPRPTAAAGYARMIARTLGAAGKAKSQLVSLRSPGISALLSSSHPPPHANLVALRPYSNSTRPAPSQSPELQPNLAANMADGVDVQPQTTPAPPSVNDLPPETLAFAARMFDAAREGNTELLVQATQRGLPANLTNEKGNTLLMLAAYAGHAATVRGLISAGADPNRLNDNLQSPLAGVIFKGHDEIAKILLDAGADPRLGKPSAIETAKMFGKNDMLQLLGAKEEDVGDVPDAVRLMAEANARK